MTEDITAQLQVAVLKWLPILGHVHGNVRNRLCLLLVAVLPCTLLGATGTAAADQPALTRMVPAEIRRGLEGKVDTAASALSGQPL